MIDEQELTYDEMNLTEKQLYWEAQGWKYVFSGKTWTGGLWLHEELGTVNSQGGYFQTITAALAAMERFSTAYMHLTN